MAFSAPGAYLTHQQKVLRLYKRALRHLESWCIHSTHLLSATVMLLCYRHERCFRLHCCACPLTVFGSPPLLPEYSLLSPRNLPLVPEWCLDYWHPSEKAMYPDYFAKREQWKKLRRESWEREVKQLQEETPPGGPKTEALPPARKEGDLPPLWWHIVTRPRERPT
nr:NADH dehydrogenase [ubiquinone] 1 beta subcomplex subunit 9 isoform X2 [Oryctolagus cuniculus]XP_051700778.1 NADH dehydrogenase [ubiquinone] 1 beta subcomplex subunit 9 isoform X2 [Oryctolagus cuniculus]